MAPKDVRAVVSRKDKASTQTMAPKDVRAVVSRKDEAGSPQIKGPRHAQATTTGHAKRDRCALFRKY
jgi:hypothetical protein